MFNFKDTPYFLYLSHLGMDMNFNQIALPRYSFLFLSHMDMDCKQVVLPRYFLSLSHMDMDCKQIALQERDQKYTLLCSFGSYGSYHSTWHYSQLGLVGKIFVICKIFFDAMTFYSQLHNCQLGPFDGLALGMAHGNQPPKHTSINQWMGGGREIFFHWV
jgi:hypothetical protein